MRLVKLTAISIFILWSLMCLALTNETVAKLWPLFWILTMLGVGTIISIGKFLEWRLSRNLMREITLAADQMIEYWEEEWEMVWERELELSRQGHSSPQG